MIWLTILIIIAGAYSGALSMLLSVLAFSIKALIGLIAAIGILMIYIQNRKP
jgi:hypothetical protein